MNNFIKENWFKLIASILLLWALKDNPYGYYQLLRWSILIIGGYSAYLAYGNKNVRWIWIFSIMAIIFNPIIPFYFSKDTWQFIDATTAAIFFYSIINKK